MWRCHSFWLSCRRRVVVPSVIGNLSGILTLDLTAIVVAVVSVVVVNIIILTVITVVVVVVAVAATAAATVVIASATIYFST